MKADEDEALAVKAVKQGAQDYLFKDQVDGSLLVRSIREPGKGSTFTVS